eukprot:scaffold40503_cov145-Amphora_coffeaeformis.AAC.1
MPRLCFSTFKTRGQTILVAPTGLCRHEIIFSAVARDTWTDKRCHDYAYDHPEGTGKEESPFRSMWFCGLPRGRHGLVREFWKTYQTPHQEQQANLYLSLAELEDALVINTQHRPNPKQRKKKRKMLQQQQHTAGGQKTLNLKVYEEEKTKSSTASSLGKKKSKYRDDSGTRKRRRF